MRRAAASTASGVLAATRQLRRPTFTLRSFSRTSVASRSTRCLPTTISSTSAALAGAGAAAAAASAKQYVVEVDVDSNGFVDPVHGQVREP